MRNHANPCLQCGACCAYYRASFYWAESDDLRGVPPELTDKLNDFYVVMKVSQGPRPRCVALQGDVGIRVWCSIYERRASVCRNFIPSWGDGIPNERCDKARAAWNLKPLTPDVWHIPDDFDQAA
jgi:Fe-S-cluster containining protein